MKRFMNNVVRMDEEEIDPSMPNNGTEETAEGGEPSAQERGFYM